MTMITANKKLLSLQQALRGRTDKNSVMMPAGTVITTCRKQKAATAVISETSTIHSSKTGAYWECLPADDEMVKITEDKLLQKGFVFKYHTHTYTTQEGNIYYYCYDYGYLPLENKWYMVVRRKEQ